jgi:shikimate dehydrogenase
MITGRAILAGVMGYPVSHSRSPRLHNFWLARHGIDGAYVPLPTPPEHFAVAVAGLRAAGFAGVNVTIPHKEAAFALCDTLDHGARRIGACNTLVFSETGILGGNTDGYGFLQNLATHGVQPHGPALLLGAGGAARAIAAALLDAGAQVSVANRSVERTERLCEVLPGLRSVPWEQRDAALADHALLVNTTSLGMLGQPSLLVDFARAAKGLAVADIVYAPLETPLLAQARACGFVTVPGLGMLLHQAVPGFAAWFGVTPRVDDEVLAVLSA